MPWKGKIQKKKKKEKRIISSLGETNRLGGEGVDFKCDAISLLSAYSEREGEVF